MKNPTSQMQMVLDAHKAMGPLPIETLTPEIARQIPLADRAAVATYGQHFLKRALAPMPLPVGKVEHRQIAGEQSLMLLRIYTPHGDAPKGGWPALVYYHGGGFVIATLDTYDSSCRALCEGAKCVVVSAHYSQAPERPFPAAYHDALTAFEWARSHATSFGANPMKIAIGGESAGGNLAAAVSQTLRNQEKQLPLHQLLIYPVTDMVSGPDSPSARIHAEAKPLNTAMLHWFYDLYTPNAEDRHKPEASPMFGDTAGLPPATVILAELDPLRSEGEAYAQKMRASGVPVDVKVYEGVTHEFFGMAGLVDEATDAVKLACSNLRDAWDGDVLSPLDAIAEIEDSSVIRTRAVA